MHSPNTKFSISRFNFKTINQTIATTAIAAMLVSCGSGNGGDANEDNTPQSLSALNANLIELPENTISRIGIVSIGSVGRKNYGYASFFDYGETVDQGFLDSLLTVGDINTCNISVDSTDDSQDINAEVNSKHSELLDNARYMKAGSALSISTPAGSWPDLVLLDEPDFPNYYLEANGAILGDLPKDSVLNIPGDEFPAFTNVTIPTIESLTDASLSNVEDASVSPDTVITWAGPENQNSNSFITLNYYSELYDISDNSALTIKMFCTIADDGEFTFPDNAKQLLSSYELLSDELVLTRASFLIITEGNTAVITTNDDLHYF